VTAPDHRDIKPGNLMVRDGQLLLIDVFFCQVRPSPWRQAVDLGNMMLVLAVRSDPARVYRRAVPSSARLPCIAALPSGWTAAGADIRNGQAQFWLDSDQAGPRAVTVTLTARCDTSGASRIPSDQPGAERFERPLSLRPRFTLLRFYTVPGGCVTYQFSFLAGAAPALAIPIDTAIAFADRSTLTGYVHQTEGLALCGRKAPCPR
jgi:hypothetical protein